MHNASFSTDFSLSQETSTHFCGPCLELEPDNEIDVECYSAEASKQTYQLLPFDENEYYRIAQAYDKSTEMDLESETRELSQTHWGIRRLGRQASFQMCLAPSDIFPPPVATIELGIDEDMKPISRGRAPRSRGRGRPRGRPRGRGRGGSAVRTKRKASTSPTKPSKPRKTETSKPLKNGTQTETKVETKTETETNQPLRIPRHDWTPKKPSSRKPGLRSYVPPASSEPSAVATKEENSGP